VYPHPPVRLSSTAAQTSNANHRSGNCERGKMRRRDIETIDRFDDSRIKHASGLDFLATLTRREQVVRDEELQLRIRTMKINLFLSTWDTSNHRLRRTRLRAIHECMSRERAHTAIPPQAPGSIDRLSCADCLVNKGGGNGGTEA